MSGAPYSMEKMYFFQNPAPIYLFVHIPTDCVATQYSCTKRYMISLKIILLILKCTTCLEVYYCVFEKCLTVGVDGLCLLSAHHDEIKLVLRSRKKDRHTPPL